MTDRLYCRESGASSATPLVLLHGFAGSHHVWDSVIEALGDEVWVLAYDLPGHGASLDYPGKPSAKAAAAAVLDDLRQRGIGQAHLGGHSMGGAASTLLAATAPDIAASLTLFAPGGFDERINGPLLRRYAAARDTAALETCLREMSGPAAVIEPATVDRALVMRLRDGQLDVFLELGAAITRGDKQGVIPQDMISAIPCPIAMAWGTRDAVLPAPHLASLAAKISFEWIDEAGHRLPEEVPEAVAEMLIRQMTVTSGT
ncbi:alpha/beta fold hydrolase [Oryzicola mucosus]|uniref:Alpha/beta fold hydrolase n=1 Tax=Oryzicola mucosus TaxID=2767425 RepID=A0A8J6Q193_9HYPH|nr:alpha/beta fold hydrolase [Oryzicola mucosus]MBD0414485.1 alpha/beta fold hydrolase [Oryzicola mucosus]